MSQRMQVLAAIAIATGLGCGPAPRPSPGPGSAAPSDVAQAAPTTANLVERMRGLLLGTMSSARHALEDPSYQQVTLRHCAITVADAEPNERFLLVAQAIGTRPMQPYRVRFLRLAPSTHSDRVRATTYEPANGAEAASLCDATGTPAIGRADLGVERCTTELRWLDGAFVGESKARQCPSDYNGAAYVTTQVRLGEAYMESWDRGYDARGAQVWGAVAGPYRFDRVAPETLHPRVVDIASFIVGRSDNRDQVTAAQASHGAAGFVPVSYRICPIAIDGGELPAGAESFFVHQEIAFGADRPPFVRERIYAFYPGAGERLGFTSWDFREGTSHAAVCDLPASERPAIAGAAVKWDEGCAMEFRAGGDHAYTGATLAGGCKSTYRGAVRLEIEATLRDGAFDIWERWFDAAGKQVAGSEQGPYEYRRMPRE